MNLNLNLGMGDDCEPPAQRMRTDQPSKLDPKRKEILEELKKTIQDENMIAQGPIPNPNSIPIPNSIPTPTLTPTPNLMPSSSS